MTILSQLQHHQIDELIELNAQSFVEAFRLENVPFLHQLVHKMMRSPARGISKTVLTFDASVLSVGLDEASRWLLKACLTDVVAYNTQRIPQTGPLLVVSNHPGMTDAFAIFTSLPRQDVKVVAKQNPILGMLNGMKSYLIFVPDTNIARISTIRTVTRHLQAGKTVILFPAGEIEPDPALRDNASETLSNWSESIRLFARYVPQLQILPVAVGGVISQAATRHPIVDIYQTQARRDWVAATLMVMLKQYREVTVSVRYGEAIIDNYTSIMDTINDQMHAMLTETWQQCRFK